MVVNRTVYIYSVNIAFIYISLWLYSLSGKLQCLQIVQHTARMRSELRSSYMSRLPSEITFII